MEKSGLVLGGIFGTSVAIVLFMILMIPPLGIDPEITIAPEITVNPDIIVDAQNSNLDDLSLVQIFERAEPGVVQINVKKNIPDVTGTGLGSGFVYDTKGHIITNAHVVDDAEKIIVTFLDGRSYNADLIGIDSDTDLAILRVHTIRSTLHPLMIGDSSLLKIGEPIVAIGNPFGLSGSMTSGIISQMGRLLPQASGFSIPVIIQTDAAINPGNSGGPLINMRGEVVGINTAIQSTTGEFTGVGFAVPSNTVQKIVPVLIAQGEYKHPWLGVRGIDIGPDYAEILKLIDARGFLIIAVLEDGPAFKAGLLGATETIEKDDETYHVGGDVVLTVDGTEVRKIDDILLHLQREKAAGDDIVLEILRDGRINSIVITLAERPDS